MQHIKNQKCEDIICCSYILVPETSKNLLQLNFTASWNLYTGKTHRVFGQTRPERPL